MQGISNKKFEMLPVSFQLYHTLILNMAHLSSLLCLSLVLAAAVWDSASGLGILPDIKAQDVPGFGFVCLAIGYHREPCCLKDDPEDCVCRDMNSSCDCVTFSDFNIRLFMWSINSWV